MSSPRMPALFLGHGSPMNVLEDNRYTHTWQQLGQTLPRPKAIVAISAHWYTQGTAVTAMAQPRTLHDFGGFPQALFNKRYPVPGSPVLAQQVQSLLAPVAVHADTGEWGLDHGTWGVLIKMYRREAGVWLGEEGEAVAAPAALAALSADLSGCWATAGTGWQTYPTLLQHDGLQLVAGETLLPSARDMLPIALHHYRHGGARPVALAEPTYLRNEVAWKKLPGRA